MNARVVCWREREREGKTDRQADIPVGRHADRQTDRPVGMHACRQAGRYANRHRQIDRQIDR